MKKIFSSSNNQLVFIIITMFLNFLGFSIIIPILPFLVKSYISNPHDIAFFVGAIMSTYALCQFIAAPGLGLLSDRYGRRPILLISLFGSVIGYLILGAGGAIWVLFLGRIIDGLTGGNISTVFAYVADITEPKDRGKYYGMLGAAGGFGFMFGPALGGLTARISLTFPLYLGAAVTLVNIIWGYFVLTESLKKENRATKVNYAHLNPFSQFSHVFSIKHLRTIFLIAFLFFFALNGMQANTSVYLNTVFNWGPTQIGFILFIVGLFDIVSQGILIRKLLPIFGPARVASFGLVLTMIGFFIAASTSIFVSPYLIYIAVIVYIIGDGLFEPSASGLISSSVGPTMQGRVQGASQGMQSISRVIGPFFAAFLFRYWVGLPYFFNAVIMGITLIILLASFNSLPKHTK